MIEKKTFITTRVKTLVPKTWQLLLLCVKVKSKKSVKCAC